MYIPQLCIFPLLPLADSNHLQPVTFNKSHSNSSLNPCSLAHLVAGHVGCDDSLVFHDALFYGRRWWDSYCVLFTNLSEQFLFSAGLYRRSVYRIDVRRTRIFAFPEVGLGSIVRNFGGLDTSGRGNPAFTNGNDLVDRQTLEKWVETSIFKWFGCAISSYILWFVVINTHGE